MLLVEATYLAEELMRRHGLIDWTFALNTRKRTLGICYETSRRIELSIRFVEHNDIDQVRDTILHEIAHALVGVDHGHDEVWRDMAFTIGANPRRTSRLGTMPPGEWQALCGGCGTLFSKHRKPKRLTGTMCKNCGPDTGRLVYEKHESTVRKSTEGRQKAQESSSVRRKLKTTAASLERQANERKQQRKR